MQDNTLSHKKQIEYNGNAYLDVKRMPVESYSALADLSLSEIFEGMKVTVLSDETMGGDLTHYIYLNGEWVLSETTVELLERPNTNCITFIALEDNSSLGLSGLSSHQTMEYSLDGIEWYTLNTSVTVDANTDESVFVRGKLTGNNSDSDYSNFKMTGKFNVEGNINTLWNHEDLEQPYYNHCACRLFRYCDGLINANKLELKSLSPYCFDRMFYGCTNLVSFPSLPFTELTEGCYKQMFEGCSSLTTVPDLPATTVTAYCYRQMFRNCSKITVTPNLPATTVAPYCYSNMFSECVSLGAVPELPATALTSNCYYGMFHDCTSLNSVPSNMLPATEATTSCYCILFQNCTSLETVSSDLLPATALATSAYTGMFQGCTSLKIVPNLPATTVAPYCYSSMFYNCSSLSTVPSVLPARTLATKCYNSMFWGCVSLTSAPELPAENLAPNCYENMFDNCTHLNYIKCLAINGINQNYSTDHWVRDVGPTGTFVKNSEATTWPINSVNGIPNGWNIVDAT